MAPSRRRGASKAAAAVAACSKWKIGDLVLAKVKGFPAWPARVSEPKNWGFKEDLKKVFVYFFGTEQIAFCAPADIESFTEEKKTSLLAKRHGKGTDFARAVKEIIDSHEELKKNEQIVADFTNEIAETNNNLSDSVPDNKMVESIHNSRKKEEGISSVLSPELKIAESIDDDSDFTSLADAAVSELEKDNLLGGKMLAEEPNLNVVVTYSSRRKLENMQISDCLTRRKEKPARRSRSSRVDASRVENFMTPQVDDGSNGDMVSNISRDRTGRRSKRLRRSSDGAVKHFTDSPASNSNGSIDENGADTAPNSDCFGFSDETVADSADKSVPTESAEHCGHELENRRKNDFQSNAVIFRKKRKPNRKRTGNETIEFTAGLDKVEKIDSDLSINGHATLSDHEKLNDHSSKENGDKHLPLVKRARVRFGASPHQLPSAGEQSDSHAADMMLGISKEISIALNCEENDYANGNSLTDGENDSASGDSHMDRGLGNLSPLNISSSKSLQSREVNKTQPFSSLVDGEAALPPSKRLHRALEAMSANAAEEGQTSFDGPALNVNTTINLHSLSSSEVSHKVTVENRVGGEVGSSDDAPKLDPAISEETVKTSKELAANDRTLDNGDQVIDESCNDPIDAVESREFKHHGSSSYKNNSCDAEDAKQDLNVSSVSGASLESDRWTPGLAVPLSDDCEAKSTKFENTFVEPEPESVDMSLDGASGEGSSPASLQQDTTSQFNEDTMELPEVPLDDGKLNYTMDDSSKKRASERSPKAITTTCQEEHVSHSNSISNDLLMEKAVSTTHSSSSVTDGLDSGRRTSPLFSSASNLVLPNKTNIAVVNNGCCSPEGHFSVDRKNNPGSKAGPGDPLESFETVLGTLTRSRESITRATHIAIDCAKIGSASRVVEIITCNLENETSLHKKVDLLFLVDSITQCSRGMKDSLGEAYLEAIQKVLSRLVPAAAPPGTSAHDNHRQCLKVLRVWLEKRVFPESIVRHHIRELDALCCSSSAGISSRSLKTERAFDDPIRQMEGMMVDEYGSNSSIQLPGFCMPPMLTDAEGGSDSDEDNFEAVTPEHNTEYREGSRVSAIEKHPHILEDVDGELEMEDLAPSCDADSSSICLLNSVHSKFEHFEHVTLPFAPKTIEPSIPPMPVESPLLPPPPPLPHAPSAIGDQVMEDDIRESFGHQLTSSRGNSFHHHGPDRRDIPHQPTRMPEWHTHPQGSSYDSRNDWHTRDSSSSYDSQPGPHPSARPGNNILPNDDSRKGFHLHPPHPAPSNHFSYPHSDQRMPSRRDAPPNPHRYPMAHCSDDDRFFRDRARMKHAPRDVDDCWRSPAPPFSGSCHPDFPRRPHGHVPYSGPPREPAFPNQRWYNPPHAGDRNHREYIPHRPPPGGPIPVFSRGSNYWRPR